MTAHTMQKKQDLEPSEAAALLRGTAVVVLGHDHTHRADLDIDLGTDRLHVHVLVVLGDLVVGRSDHSGHFDHSAVGKAALLEEQVLGSLVGLGC